MSKSKDFINKLSMIEQDDFGLNLDPEDDINASELALYSIIKKKIERKPISTRVDLWSLFSDFLISKIKSLPGGEQRIRMFYREFRKNVFGG